MGSTRSNVHSLLLGLAEQAIVPAVVLAQQGNDRIEPLTPCCFAPLRSADEHGSNGSLWVSSGHLQTQKISASAPSCHHSYSLLSGGRAFFPRLRGGCSSSGTDTASASVGSESGGPWATACDVGMIPVRAAGDDDDETWRQSAVASLSARISCTAAKTGTLSRPIAVSIADPERHR